jgi:hypothetical protein
MKYARSVLGRQASAKSQAPFQPVVWNRARLPKGVINNSFIQSCVFYGYVR